MLSCENLTLMHHGSYHESLLKDVSFSMMPASVLYIMGPNGVGKTSLLETIAGLKAPYSGKIKFNSKELRSYPQTLVNYIGHKLAIKSQLTALENLKYWAQALDGAQALQAAILYLDLGNILEQKCSMLSSGMCKKLSLARLLLSAAPIWLLDEISANLDEQNLQLLQALVSSKVSSGGIVIISSHIKPVNAQILNLEDFS